MLIVKQEGIKYLFFWVFGTIPPEVEPQSPRLLANTLTTRPMGQLKWIDEINKMTANYFPRIKHENIF